MKTNYFFPEFDYCIVQLKRFIHAYKVFTILLTDGRIVHHQPQNVSDFHKWLVQHGIEDLRAPAMN
ncbi:hypothetical protein [Dyadobacter luticola]|uniref:Uncharacterized protein n=1 Tax=Dyadobacter luticola TaxID=1979387 RepID=A0A5R9KTD1_9BACT|nr:hypothetical protein [Dyadobacter luticola]TLU99389.1 hypothetical protein FEN17_22765 [Dyadobacter luticola]